MLYLLLNLRTYFLRYRTALILGMIFVGLSAFFKAYQGKYIQLLTDFVLSSNQYLNSGILLRNIFILLALSLISGFFMFLMRQQIIVMSRHIEYDQKNDIFYHFLQLPHHFFLKGRVGDLMSRIHEDVGKVRMFTGPAIMYLTNTAVTVFTVIFFMLSSSPELTLFVLIPLPLLSVFIYHITSKIHKHALQSQEAIADITSLVQESMNGIRTIRSASKETVFVDLMLERSLSYKEKNISLAKAEALFSPVVTLLISLTILITIWKGHDLVKNQRISSGIITEFIFYLYQLTWPFTAIGWVFSLIQRGKASQERIESVLNEKIITDYGHEIPERYDIVLSDVYLKFGFKKVLHQLSLTIRENEITGLTGRTGCGKSALVSVLAGLHDIDAGDIRIGGIPFPKIDKKIFYLKTSVVFQEPFLFSDTVRNNILFGCPESPDDKELEKVARFCCIYDEIMQFPNGFDTLLGERGLNISGGQKQRIALARALIRKPQILILDDCLSALDAITAKTILQRIQAMKNITVLLISSRLSDLIYLKEIHFMENGQIICSGSHEDLLQNCSSYAKLWEIKENTANSI
ncbi:MAG: ABC transporter ATP-binding protein/permease [Bacteroidia bacterium]|nr:ABC transporter ATP-binding protein/permease [Bacteroidia bacterium]